MTTPSFIFDLNSHLQAKDDPIAMKRAICGITDDNLTLIEKEFGVVIKNADEGFVITGEPSQTRNVNALLKALIPIARKGDITAADLRMELDHLDQQTAATVGTKRSTITARTYMQSVFIEAMHKNDLTFGVGPAGTGKTFLAVAYAASLLESKAVKRIILSRPAVEAGERLGFLPGDMKEKVDPYLRPLYDALYEMLPPERVDKYLDKNVIEIAPLAFLRGRTLKNAAIIMDEAQNTTVEQMKMALTRLGEGSKMIVTGDPSQVDLPPRVESGLKDALKTLEAVDGLEIVTFSHRDVVRHGLVSRIVKAYEDRV